MNDSNIIKNVSLFNKLKLSLGLYDKIKIFIIIFLISIILFLQLRFFISRGTLTNLKLTVVTPVLDTKIEINKNFIYCSTFQMAWNKACKDVVKENIEIEGSPEYVAKLNKNINQPPNVSNNSYLAMAGFGKDGIVDKINEALMNKFSGHVQDLKIKPRDIDIVAYSYLYKNLPFENEFERLENPIDFKFEDKSIPVKAFGIKEFDPNKHKLLADQVEILYYNNQKNSKPEFIIKLVTKSKNDELIISTIPIKETLEKTYENIIQLSEFNEHKKLVPGAIMKIPLIDFDIIHTYKELSNKKLKNTKYSEYFISDATQGIKFKLNEKGAELESFSFFMMTGSSGPRYKLIVDSPFIIFLKDKNFDMPYFMAYISNDELLVRK